MTRLSKFFIMLLLLSFTLTPSYCVLEGSVNNSLGIDYTKLNKDELEIQADISYKAALSSTVLNENVTQALNLYTILKNINPKQSLYSLRLGKLYDILGKDNLAKTNYFQAIGVNPKNPEPYFYLGNYYYSREQYRQALKYYQKSYEKGYSSNYDLIKNINEIYIKFGDEGSNAFFAPKSPEYEKEIFNGLEILEDEALEKGIVPASNQNELKRELQELKNSNIFIDVKPVQDNTLFEEIPDL